MNEEKLKAENKELKKDIALLNKVVRELRGKVIEEKRTLFSIEASYKKSGDCGSRSRPMAIAASPEDAKLIQIGLNKVLGFGFSSECGDSKIGYSVSTRVTVLHPGEATDFIKSSRF